MLQEFGLFNYHKASSFYCFYPHCYYFHFFYTFSVFKMSAQYMNHRSPCSTTTRSMHHHQQQRHQQHRGAYSLYSLSHLCISYPKRKGSHLHVSSPLRCSSFQARDERPCWISLHSLAPLCQRRQYEDTVAGRGASLWPPPAHTEPSLLARRGHNGSGPHEK